MSIHIDTQGTGTVSDDQICAAVRDFFPLSPGGIIDYLKLRRPVFRATAAGGHFGRSGEGFTWESTDRAKEFAAACNSAAAAV